MYAIQVRTGSEENFINRINTYHFDLKIYFPKRSLKIRKEGKVSIQNQPVFSGYVFAESEIDNENKWFIKQTAGFIRFLKSNYEITPLSRKDTEIVNHFIRNKGISKVKFNEQNKIVVLEGCLKGLEGNIVKVNKRKGRAKIKLDLYDDSFTVDLAFEVIGAA
ncbi:MAG: antiterminator LoaP [Treponema sp.]|nr:antiterminator LoaP [Treponema sp.]